MGERGGLRRDPVRIGREERGFVFPGEEREVIERPVKRLHQVKCRAPQHREPEGGMHVLGRTSRMNHGDFGTGLRDEKGFVENHALRAGRLSAFHIGHDPPQGVSRHHGGAVIDKSRPEIRHNARAVDFREPVKFIHPCHASAPKAFILN